MKADMNDNHQKQKTWIRIIICVVWFQNHNQHHIIRSSVLSIEFLPAGDSAQLLHSPH